MAKNESEYAVHIIKDGETHSVLPGEDIPDWAEITNPYLTGKVDEDEHPQSSPAVFSGPPPQAGVGSSRQVWADYATANGVEVKDDHKREDIIASCEKAGVAV